VLPVSTVFAGSGPAAAYGLRDVAISVPTQVGRAGAEKILEIEIWPKELQALQRSAGVLRDTLASVFGGKPACRQAPGRLIGRAAPRASVCAPGPSVPQPARRVDRSL
jgi:L-lactate dehydrogenase